jgi:putative hemolysin
MQVIKKIKAINLNPVQKIYKYRFFNFRQKVSVFYETDRYILKTASSLKELEKSLFLRYKVFYKEKVGKMKITGFDTDKYDKNADHLIIIDKNSNKIIGTYRVLSSLYTDRFYSQSEFNIDDLKNRNVNLLELGRSAIDKNYRNGVVLSLLWQGISIYAKKINADYVFGLSSIFSSDIKKAVNMYKYLNSKGLIEHKFNIYPVGKYKILGFEQFL